MLSHAPALESTHLVTLTAAQRRLALRLEGFGDIVFGFAVSQCALQLPIRDGHVDLHSPLGLMLYFSTYALLASLWLTYHRLLSGPFLPAGLDLLLAFAYLAFISILPDAQYAITHSGSFVSARSAVIPYTIDFGAVVSVAAILSMRNLRRGWHQMEPADRDVLWRAFVRRTTLGVLMLIAVTVDLTAGPLAANGVFFSIFLAMALVRGLAKHAPSATWLHISEPRGSA